jgi:hypothetical protein
MFSKGLTVLLLERIALIQHVFKMLKVVHDWCMYIVTVNKIRARVLSILTTD